MSPTYPDGTILLVAGGEFPERGDIVAARNRENRQVVVKKYQRKDNVITLSSINPNSKNLKWNIKEKPGFLEWMWPVLHDSSRTANINTIIINFTRSTLSMPGS